MSSIPLQSHKDTNKLEVSGTLVGRGIGHKCHCRVAGVYRHVFQTCAHNLEAAEQKVKENIVRTMYFEGNILFCADNFVQLYLFEDLLMKKKRTESHIYLCNVLYPIKCIK